MSDEAPEIWRRQAERERKARLEAESIAERATRELYDTITTLREINESLSTPALLVQPGILLVPLIGAVDRERITRLTTRVLHACRDRRARALVVDLTGVPSLDAVSGASLHDAFRAARLLGVRVVLSGIGDQVAQALAELRFGEGIEIAGDLASGLALVAPVWSHQGD